MLLEEAFEGTSLRNGLKLTDMAIEVQQEASLVISKQRFPTAIRASADSLGSTALYATVGPTQE